MFLVEYDVCAAADISTDKIAAHCISRIDPSRTILREGLAIHVHFNIFQEYL